MVLDVLAVRCGELFFPDQLMIGGVDTDAGQIIVVHDAAQLAAILEDIKIRDNILRRCVAAFPVERFGVQRADALARAQNLRPGHLQRPGNGAVLLLCHFGQIALDDLQGNRVGRGLADQLQAQAFLQVGGADARGLHTLQQSNAPADCIRRCPQDICDRIRRLGQKPVFIQRVDQVFHDPLALARQLECGGLQEQVAQDGFVGCMVGNQLLCGDGISVRLHGPADASMLFERAGTVFDLRKLQLDHRVAGHQFPEVTAKLQVIQLKQPHGGLHGQRQSLSLAEFQIHGVHLLVFCDFIILHAKRQEWVLDSEKDGNCVTFL